jgi:hypothetical protein
MKSESTNRIDMELMERVLTMLTDMAENEDQSILFSDLFTITRVVLLESTDPHALEIMPRLLAIRDRHAQVMAAAYKREASAIMFDKTEGEA